MLESNSLSQLTFGNLSYEELQLEQAGPGLERIVIGSLRRVPQSEAPALAWPLVCGSAVA